MDSHDVSGNGDSFQPWILQLFFFYFETISYLLFSLEKVEHALLVPFSPKFCVLFRINLSPNFNTKLYGNIAMYYSSGF